MEKTWKSTLKKLFLILFHTYQNNPEHVLKVYQNQYLFLSSFLFGQETGYRYLIFFGLWVSSKDKKIDS